MNKKLILPIIVIAVLVLGFIVFKPSANNEAATQTPTPGASPIDTSDWKTYRNVGIELKYPSDWILAEYPDSNQPVDIRFEGEGYMFIINPDGGFGEWPGYTPIQVKVIGRQVDAGEIIDSTDGFYHLIFTLNRSESAGFYFFRINIDPKIPLIVAKDTIRRILETVKIY